MPEIYYTPPVRRTAAGERSRVPPRRSLLRPLVATAGLAAIVACAAPSRRVWGVTLDGVWEPAGAAAALAALPARPVARIVFDAGVPARAYVAPLSVIRGSAGIMGELLDSRYLAEIGAEAWAARVREYLDTLGDRVDVWEVGNEVNGEWTGAPAEVAAKTRTALDLVKARGRPAALTLHYNVGCAEKPESDLFRWVEANLSRADAARIDWLLVSWYEDDCPGEAPDWPAVFARLARLFPRAELGIGECGTKDPARKEEVLRRCYAIAPGERRFLGGYFWWTFRQDMVPASRPLHGVLSQIIRSGAGP